MTIPDPVQSEAWYPTMAQRQRSKIAIGVRVNVRSGNEKINNQEGTIIDGTATPNWDCIVQLDIYERPLGFYWQEITIL